MEIVFEGETYLVEKADYESSFSELFHKNPFAVKRLVFGEYKLLYTIEAKNENEAFELYLRYKKEQKEKDKRRIKAIDEVIFGLIQNYGNENLFSRLQETFYYKFINIQTEEIELFEQFAAILENHPIKK